MSRKVRKIITRTGAGILFCGVAMGCAYYLTPNSKKTVHLGDKSQLKSEVEESALPPHFMRFVSRLNEDTGIMDETIHEENTYYGFNVNFDDFSVSFKKDENAPLNKFEVEGDIDLKIKTIKDISFNLDVNVDYNGKDVPLEVGFVNKTAYFGLYDLRLKVGSTTIDELFGNEEEGIDSILSQIFIASKDEGGIGFDVESYIDDFINDLIDNKLAGMISNMDMSSLTSSLNLSPLEDGQQGLGLSVTEEQLENCD